MTDNVARLVALLLWLVALLAGMVASSRRSPAPTYERPRNCATAVAYGLGEAEIAQRWPHLDRDKDGVACFGN